MEAAQFQHALGVEADDEAGGVGEFGVGDFQVGWLGGRVGVGTEDGEQGFPPGLQGLQRGFPGRAIDVVHIRGMKRLSLSVFRADESGQPAVGRDLGQVQEVIDQGAGQLQGVGHGGDWGWVTGAAVSCHGGAAMSLQVAVMGDLAIAGRAQQRADGVGLIVTMFQQQGAARFQKVAGFGDDSAQRRQPIRAGGQRQAGFVAQVALPEMRVVLGDVGRVADDEVVALVWRQRCEPVALKQAKIAGAQPFGIGLGDGERLGADIDGYDSRTGPLDGEGDGDDPTAGAQIERVGGSVCGQRGKSEFNQQFGFGAGNEHARSHPKRARPEFALAGQVGDGPTVPAALDQNGIVAGLGRCQRFLGPGAQVGAIAIQYMHQQHFGIQRGGLRGLA